MKNLRELRKLRDIHIAKGFGYGVGTIGCVILPIVFLDFIHIFTTIIPFFIYSFPFVS